MIVNTQKEKIIAGFSANGTIAGWAKFYLTNDLKNPITEAALVATGTLNVAVIFTVPKDTPNGTYTGSLSVTQKAKDEKLAEGKSVAIAQKIDRQVTITVSDKEIIDVRASIIPEKYDMARGEALKIRVLYDNQGNISVTPQVQLKIKKDGQTVYSAIFPYPENQEAVKPLSQREIPAIEVPTTGFADGKYMAEIVIAQGTQKVLEKSFQFSYGIYNPVGLLAAGARNFFSGNYIVNWLLVALAAGAIGAVFMMRLIKNKKPSSML